MAVQTAAPSFASQPSPVPRRCGIDLLWLPLGARGHVAHLSGLVFEGVVARLERRRPVDLYHSALEVYVPDGRFVIETQGAIPDAYGASRGVVREGPVWSPRLARHRFFRYELRCWRDGVIADAEDAVDSPRRVAADEARSRRLLALVDSVPMPTWGRDELHAGEMWNSNSVIAWLLARCGVKMDTVRPPIGGRAPGWQAGLAIARRRHSDDDQGPRVLATTGLGAAAAREAGERWSSPGAQLSSQAAALRRRT